MMTPKSLRLSELRACTYYVFDGGTQVCVPERDNAIDHDLWQIHLEMVKEAQEPHAIPGGDGRK